MTKLLDKIDPTSPNQLYPHTNKWAYELYEAGQKNNWVPTHVNMQIDINQWHSTEVLSDDERLMIKRCLGFFAGAESLVNNNLMFSIARYVNDGECRNYLARQIFEESLHNQTIVHICSSLGLEPNELYQAYNNISSVKKKTDFLIKITTDLVRPDFDISTKAGKIELLQNIFVYYILCEGLLFYSGFAMLLSMSRHSPPKIPGIAKQVAYSLRDENQHLEFGTKLFNQLRSEYSFLKTTSIDKQLLEFTEEAKELEKSFARDILPHGILGMNASMVSSYIDYLADRRLRQVGLSNKQIKKINNPFPWLSEIIDLPKNTNFFEGVVIDYQTGGLKDDF